MKQLKNIPALRRKFVLRTSGIGVIGVIVIIGLMYSSRSRNALLPHSIAIDTASIAHLASRGDSVATMDDRASIMAQFVCNCGSCKIVDDLRDCNCRHPGGALEVKRYIDDRIREQRSSAKRVVDLVAKTFGGQKKGT
jgi:hypothetical protein